jgi:hypothetical protein
MSPLPSGVPEPDRHVDAARRERSSATLITVSDVHHCPYCELRFVSRNELEDHVAVDHPLDHPPAVEDDTATDHPLRTPPR